MEFTDGRKVKSISFDDDSLIEDEFRYVKSMTISLESGHMAHLPFVRLEYTDGTVGMVDVHKVFVVLHPAEEEADDDA